MLKFIDISYHNTSEYNSLTRRMTVHEFDWQKAISQGVVGALIKANEGLSQDVSYDLSMSTCTLPYRTAFGFVNYTKKSYVLGNEIAWGKQQGQRLVELANKYKHNVRVMVDGEQNAKWESITNTNTDRVIDRFLKISLHMVLEIHRLTGYWPIFYTNKYLTKFMHNFTDCPLHLAVGSEIKPIRLRLPEDENSPRVGYFNWDETSLIQYHWKGDGRTYGNYIGNPDIDLDSCEDINKILIPGMTSFSDSQPEDEPVPQPEPTNAEKLNILWDEYKKTH